MKQYLTLNNLKILTLLVGLIGTIFLVVLGTDEHLGFGIDYIPDPPFLVTTAEGYLEIHFEQIIPWQLRTIFFFWTPYFFVKILELFLKDK